MTSHDFARMFWKAVDFEKSVRNRMPESGDAGEDHRRTPAPGPFGGHTRTEILGRLQPPLDEAPSCFLASLPPARSSGAATSRKS